QRAAEQGNADAQYLLGDAYFNRKGTIRNDIEALRWWRQAAAQEHPVAQNDLGTAHGVGRGEQEPQDAEAAVWFHLAARAGLALAQANLGVLYELGQGVLQDFEEAARWYRRAAEQGNATAQSRLGFLYEHGRGLPEDLVRAYFWYHLVAAQGDATAIDQRQVLATRMTPAQLDEARQLAQTFKPGDEALQGNPAPAPAVAIPSSGTASAPARPGD